MSYYTRTIVLAVITAASFSACTRMHQSSQQTRTTSIHEKLAELETSTGGRIGLSAINTVDNTSIQYRTDERFPMCSSFKAMAVAAILKKSMTDKALMAQRIFYEQKDVKNWGYTPITEKQI